MKPNPLLCLVAGALLACPVLSHAQNYLFTNFDGPPDNGGGTTVNGINNNGAEVGFSANAAGDTFTNFIRNPNGSFTLLNIGGDTAAMANGINNANTVVGVNGNGLAFSLAGGSSTPTVLPLNTAASVAFGINDQGVIVGQFADAATGTTPGFVDNMAAVIPLNPTVGAVVTNAQGINNKGIVTGFYSANAANPGIDQHGFLYDTNMGMFTLLPDPSTARTMADGLVLTQFLGINDNGEAAGYYQTNNGSQFGFLFNTNTDTYRFLDDPLAAPVGGVQITQITGINNAGDLSGFFVNGDGVQQGFFALAVPEPGSCALLIGLGFSSVPFLYRRRRTR